jgi:hypothetical protein
MGTKTTMTKRIPNRHEAFDIYNNTSLNMVPTIKEKNT